MANRADGHGLKAGAEPMPIAESGEFDYPQLFGQERECLLALLRRLTPEEWECTTVCPGWVVHDVANHVLGGDLGLLARHRDGHFGTPPPDGVGDREFIEWLDALQDDWVHATRRISPRLVTDLLAWTAPQIVTTLAAQDPTQWAATVSWASDAPVPRWLDQARELSECWIHRQQLLMALDLPVDVSDTTTAAILAALRWAYPYRLSSVASEPGDTVIITITGGAAATWTLVSTGADMGFSHEPGRRIVARAEMSSDQAWRLLSNNLTPAELAVLEVKGSQPFVDVLLSTRAIIGMAKP